MTHRERLQLRQAIHLINHDYYDAGMQIICSLAGVKVKPVGPTVAVAPHEIEQKTTEFDPECRTLGQ